jgi:hypothetical protein
VAPRAYWKGYLKLSLVSCPIALFADALDVPITAFFDGIAESLKRPEKRSSLAELMAEPRAHKLLEAFRRIPDPLQIAVLRFARSLRTAKRRRKKANLIDMGA